MPFCMYYEVSEENRKMTDYFMRKWSKWGDIFDIRLASSTVSDWNQRSGGERRVQAKQIEQCLKHIYCTRVANSLTQNYAGLHKRKGLEALADEKISYPYLNGPIFVSLLGTYYDLLITGLEEMEQDEVILRNRTLSIDDFSQYSEMYDGMQGRYMVRAAFAAMTALQTEALPQDELRKRLALFVDEHYPHTTEQELMPFIEMFRRPKNKKILSGKIC